MLIIIVDKNGLVYMIQYVHDTVFVSSSDIVSM